MIEVISVPLWNGGEALAADRLVDGDIAVYAALLQHWPLDRVTVALDPGERSRLGDYLDHRAGHRFACGRALLRSVLAARHGRPDAVIEAGAGKPWIPGGPEIGLAHAGDLVVAAVSARPIGIDVEPIRSPTEDLLRGALHPDERAGDARRFTRLWTAKEAAIKRTGAGLATDPRTLRVDLEAGRVEDTSTGERVAVRWLGHRGHILCWTQ